MFINANEIKGLSKLYYIYIKSFKKMTIIISIYLSVWWTALSIFCMTLSSQVWLSSRVQNRFLCDSFFIKFHKKGPHDSLMALKWKTRMNLPHFGIENLINCKKPALFISTKLWDQLVPPKYGIDWYHTHMISWYH